MLRSAVSFEQDIRNLAEKSLAWSKALIWCGRGRWNPFKWGRHGTLRTVYVTAEVSVHSMASKPIYPYFWMLYHCIHSSHSTSVPNGIPSSNSTFKKDHDLLSQEKEKQTIGPHRKSAICTLSCKIHQRIREGTCGVESRYWMLNAGTPDVGMKLKWSAEIFTRTAGKVGEKKG